MSQGDARQWQPTAFAVRHPREAKLIVGKHADVIVSPDPVSGSHDEADEPDGPFLCRRPRPVLASRKLDDRWALSAHVGTVRCPAQDGEAKNQDRDQDKVDIPRAGNWSVGTS